jgi:putative glutamine amidotransferase
VVPEKDETDLLVLEHVESLGLPVLAICYGMQALNVSRGGTLIQDIEAQGNGNVKHEQGLPLERESHGVTLANESIVSAAAGKKLKWRVNSHHHQAVAELGRDLKAVAWASDGVIEGVEDSRSGRYVVGVQWHPELSWRTDELSRAIFESFVSRCSLTEAEDPNRVLKEADDAVLVS